jgi:hypothetical protein
MSEIAIYRHYQKERVEYTRTRRSSEERVH